MLLSYTCDVIVLIEKRGMDGVKVTICSSESLSKEETTLAIEKFFLNQNKRSHFCNERKDKNKTCFGTKNISYFVGQMDPNIFIGKLKNK